MSGRPAERPDPGRQIEQLLARFRGFDVPRDRVDPRTLPAHLLAAYGLPPRPIDGTPAAAWDEIFGRELQLLPFEFHRDLFEKLNVRISRRQDALSLPSTSRFETSRNWAGAYISSNKGLRFSQIWGVWRVPATLTVPAPPRGGQPGIQYVAANWIGLDGQRAYVDSSLPQLGTLASLGPGGIVTATSWIQWWAQYDPVNLGPLPTGVAVSPGDLVGAVLTVVGPSKVNCVMANLSTGVALPVSATAPPVILPSGVTVTPQVEGATAEWILERPEVLHTTTPYNLGDYGTTRFDFCVAVESAPSAPGTPQVLEGARDIRMYDILLDPVRLELFSMPDRIDDITLEVRFGGF